MAFDAADVRGWIVDALESNADWRSRKVDEYPDDDRNREAAADSLRLREEVAALPSAAFEGIASYVNSSATAAFRVGANIKPKRSRASASARSRRAERSLSRV